MRNNVLTGPAGWQYDDWVGPVYPRRPGRNFDALAFVASYFDLIEINSTFYRIPSPESSRSWCRRVAHLPRVRFTAKLVRTCTHSPGALSSTELRRWAHAMSPLVDSNRLSCALVQFPWSVRDTPDARNRIAQIAQALQPIPIAVEVRHGSWHRMDSMTGVTFCGIDQPVIGNSLAPGSGIPGPAGYYFRLHGQNLDAWFDRDAGRDERYNYEYDDGRLAPWITRIRRAADTGKTVHVVLNNHFRGQAIANAFDISSALAGGPVRAPATIRAAFPRLTTKTRPAERSATPQSDLFE